MTCIVGIAEGGSVWIGGDSAGVAGLDLRTRADEKVFRNGPMLFGYCGSFRLGQLLRFKLTPPPQTCRDDYQYMVTDFIDAVRHCLRDGGYQKKENERESGGFFLVGYKGSMYEVQEDYQVAMYHDGVASTGCGSQVALGALYVSRGAPASRIRTALKAAETFSAGVRGPFVVRSLKQAGGSQ